MDVISYRGPGAAGGVSSGLESNWRKQGKDTCWWYIANEAISVLCPEQKDPQFITQLSENVVKGHYHFCNEFIWPIMHDLPEFASYSDKDHLAYRELNAKFNEYITFSAPTGQKKYFVQDYQLALLPSLLSEHGARSVVFWHIPWPKNVRADFVEPIREIARGILSCEAFGFHTEEYAQNFMDFVAEHVKEFDIDREEKVIRLNPRKAGRLKTQSDFLVAPYTMRPLYVKGRREASVTSLIVHPLGIDSDFWKLTDQSHRPDSDHVHRFSDMPFILSVERADYTKGVLERLQAVELFFEAHPENIGKMRFVQVCGKTRPGLNAFDQYWQDCKATFDGLNSRLGSGSWRPVEWLEDPIPAQQLKDVYGAAAAMLVNPLRDGLNLTAKEYVACQPCDPGVLLLSPGAGAWHELKNGAVESNPRDPDQFVDSIQQAMNMSELERRARHLSLKESVEANPLDSWWHRFSEFQPAARQRASIGTISDTLGFSTQSRKRQIA